MGVNDDATGWGDTIGQKDEPPGQSEEYSTVDNLIGAMVVSVLPEGAVKYFEE